MSYPKSRPKAFTLIEIMIVIGIMGIMLTMGVPLVYKAWHKAPMDKAIADVVEVCSHARALSILQGHEVDVLFHPRAGRLEVSGAAAPSGTADQPGGPPASFSPPATSGSGLAAVLSERVSIEMLDINKLPHDFRDDETARVRFFPNGTCDELTLILLSDTSERREITLEITTGLASVEYNPNRFR